MKDTIDGIRERSDAYASGPDYLGNGYRDATRHVRVLLCEVDRLRSELDARIAISPEDAAAMVGARIFTTETDAAERVAAALRAHAEKARKL